MDNIGSIDQSILAGNIVDRLVASNVQLAKILIRHSVKSVDLIDHRVMAGKDGEASADRLKNIASCSDKVCAQT